MVLQPVGADHDVAENQREIFAPLLGHGARQVAVAMRALGRSGDLDLDDQQGQRDCENRVAEPLEAVSPRSAPCVSALLRWLVSLRSIMLVVSPMQEPILAAQQSLK
jgi:hypothetical protein